MVENLMQNSSKDTITTHSFELISMDSGSGRVKQNYQTFKHLYFGSDRKLV
jgi:hypothetical protein